MLKLKKLETYYPNSKVVKLLEESSHSKGKVSYSIVEADKYNGAIVTPIENQLQTIETEVEEVRALKKSLF